ncbi:MAG: serine/threonine protein kinase, partial [Verrucomicrobiales bacterium]|nr:serine/threonine protein kinase [Verrucomicrobiales bacterium]
MSGSESASSFRCPECGRPLWGNAPPGLCSYCLLARALAVPDEAADFVSPAAKELSAEFADLEVRDLLGRGGMGAVYLGWQKSLQRTVALKLLPRELLANEEFLERFQREGRVMAKLDHPNIARVFDAGITDSGWPYLLMELISGQPINVFVRERQLLLRQRLELFEAVCRAVQHAHQKGVIHRDLKPSNILVADTGDRPVPKVIDFGLARPVQEPGADQAIWRSHAHAVGTPAYMSPEQAAGDSDLDTRTDVYSLGVLLYELLTGLVPFDVPDPASVSVNEIQRLIRETPSPKPSERLTQHLVVASRESAADLTDKNNGALARRRYHGLKEIIPVLRGDLDCITLKALQKEREHRYESAAALAADIVRYLNHEPVLASPQTPLYRARKFTRRHRVSLSATAAVTLALLAATAVSAWQAVRATRAEDVTARRLYYSEMNGVLLDLKEGRSGRFEALRSRPGFVAAAEKFRGWEWYLADALSDRSIMSIQAHKGRASALAITPAGDRLASAGDDGVVRIWNAQTGALLSSHAAGSPVRTLSWHPNGQLLAAGTSDGRLLEWNLPGGQPSHGTTVQRFNDSTVSELRPHEGAINAVTWTRDGRRFATAGDDANLIVWDATNQTEVVRFSHANSVLAAAWAPDGENIASACGAGCPGVQVWNVAERRLRRTLQDPFTVAVISLDWNPDGKQRAMGTAHWYVKVFDVETSKELFVRRLHRAPVGVVNWSADGQRLLTAADDGTLRVYHFDMGSTHTVLAGHSGPVRAAVWLNGSSGVASAGEDGSVRLWPAYDWIGSLVHFRCVPWASGIDFDPTGRLLAVTAGAEPVSVWDVQTGVRLHWLTGHLTPLRGLDWSPNGHLLAAGDAEGNVHVWNAATGEGHTNLTVAGAVADLEWSPDGRRVLVLGENSSEAKVLTIRESSKDPPGFGLRQSSGALESVAETNSVRKRQRTGALQDAIAPMSLSFRVGATITAGAWSPDGRQIALGDDRGALNTIDAQDGRTLQTVQPGGQAIRRLSWRPDGMAIALGREDGSLIAVELATGSALWSTRSHRGPITEVCWHPRDRRIATGGQDGTVKLFDAGSGEEIVV